MVDDGDDGRVDEGEQFILVSVLRADRTGGGCILEPKAVIGIQKHQVAAFDPLESTG